MELTSLTLYPFFDSEGVLHLVEFECPGCGYGHAIHVVRQSNPKVAVWDWNGSLVKPTLNPSILVQLGDGKVCHSFVREGQIQFLDDCFHALKGQTVPLIAYPPDEFDGCALSIGQLAEQYP